MEIEAKFVIQDTQTDKDLRLTTSLGCFSISAGQIRHTHDTYFDTPDRRLLQAGYACRQREQDGDTIITVKSLRGVEGAVHRREELEITLPACFQPPEQWPDSAARQKVLALIEHQPLRPLFSLKQQRLVREVWHTQRLIAELSLDTVTLAHTGSDHVYHELEIELKGAGTENDLAAIVDALAGMPGLTPEPRSKFERGLAALDGDCVEDMPLFPADDAPGIAADNPMSEAARKTLRFHLLRMLANEAGTRAGIDIEALHDMRVATRRIRTAFYVFAGILNVEATAPYLKELQRAGRVLGCVRDLDVFREKAQAYLRAFPKGAKPDLALLMQAWDAEYERARTKLLKYLGSQHYRRFKQTFPAFLASPLPPAVSAAQRVSAVLPDLIAARLTEFYACKTRLDQPGAALTDYHQMRIVAKYLRYTLEYFREVLGPAGEQAIVEIKALQNHLGALQDAVVASARLQNVVAWGTWQPPTEEHLRWTKTPFVVPGVTAYLEFQQAEIRRLVETFPAAWARYEGALNERAHFTALIASATAALSS